MYQVKLNDRIMGVESDFIVACENAIERHEADNLEYTVFDSEGYQHWSTNLLYETEKIVYLCHAQPRMVASA